ncbi:GCN5-related N-acetyltransferase [Rhizobium sp. PDO1-076]|uniref:GNAT family N-acetyltransferase n=1 Tax=Rhizobium sp. PDO1-076 TaxID=1125979 RepID=UPI00024E235B|nr:GNAT family N-acetyltransferase [Rhizobium sp. PDO1-076]EHS53225.1 GCN5-related N-acetyltransferase [Rhizobium sp. PDO1-076]
MKTDNPILPLGYSALPAGTIANVVTCLEMRQRLESAKPTAAPDLALERWIDVDLDQYRSLFRRVGEDWMWVSRLIMPDDELRTTLADPGIELFAAMKDGAPVGILELDFREPGECELVFFGLVPEAIGQGAGRWLMNQALDKAWAKPITRLWLHTCHFDHPGAITFYRRSGFEPYGTFVEVTEDPRLTGKMRIDAAQHVPLIRPVDPVL